MIGHKQVVGSHEFAPVTELLVVAAECAQTHNALETRDGLFSQSRLQLLRVVLDEHAQRRAVLWPVQRVRDRHANRLARPCSGVRLRPTTSWMAPAASTSPSSKRTACACREARRVLLALAKSCWPPNRRDAQARLTYGYRWVHLNLSVSFRENAGHRLQPHVLASDGTCRGKYRGRLPHDLRRFGRCFADDKHLGAGFFYKSTVRYDYRGVYMIASTSQNLSHALPHSDTQISPFIRNSAPKKRDMNGHLIFHEDVDELNFW